MLFLRPFIALSTLFAFVSANPQALSPYKKPHCKHPSVVSCCESFFSGNNPPPGLGLNLACFDLNQSDLQCVYSQTNGKAYDYCIGTWACCEVDVASTVGLHCTSAANGGDCAGWNVGLCTGMAARWTSCLWGDSVDVGANAINNVFGDTTVDRIHNLGRPSEGMQELPEGVAEGLAKEMMKERPAVGRPRVGTR